MPLFDMVSTSKRPRRLIAVSGRVDRAFATEAVDSGSIYNESNQKPLKLVFTSSVLDVQQ